jgi:hypothetical protein
MAATNYTPIQLYYSTTASAVPLAANLVSGELAINITDGKIYYKDNAGVVQLFGSKSDLTTISFGSTGLTPSTATGGAVTVAGTLITSNGGTGLSSFAAGDIMYYSSGTAMSKLTIGTNGQILTSNGTAPTWTSGSSITVGIATNLAGGAAGSVPYQSGASTTTFLSIGTSNQVLTSSGTAPQWSSSLTLTGLTDSGNLTFTGTGNRITGDFSNATVASRVAFQTSTTNSNTGLIVLPNGTATTANIQFFNNSDPTNASSLQIANLSTESTIRSLITGTGTYLPMTFYTGGSERARIDINGLIGVGTASATSMLQTAGSSSVSAFKTPNIAEVDTISATAATGTINFDITTQSVLYYTSNASANWTVNFRGSSGTSLNTLMQTGECISATFLVTQGSTAYYNSAVTIDGASVTPKWQGGSAPTSGNASSVDCYTYVIQKTGSATFAVLASQTKFA